MTELPAELTIIPEDLDGHYCDGCDCPIARALRRSGVRMDEDDGYYVCGWGVVEDPDNEEVGQYQWKYSHDQFNGSTANQPGTLVLMEVPE